MSERETLTASLEYAIAALRSNQDVLLHKVPRTEVVKEQLALNLAAIGKLKDDLAREGIHVN